MVKFFKTTTFLRYYMNYNLSNNYNLLIIEYNYNYLLINKKKKKKKKKKKNVSLYNLKT